MTLSTSRCRTRGTSKSAWVLFACVLLLTACSATVPPPRQPVHVGHPAPAAPGDALAASPLEAGPAAGVAARPARCAGADMMRGRIRNDEDFGQAANAAIGRNTDDLGAAGRRAVRRAGRGPVPHHLGRSRDRTVQLLAGVWPPTTRPSVTDARTALVGLRERPRRLLLGGVGGPAGRGTARTAVITHVDHLLAPGRRLRGPGLPPGQRALPARATRTPSSSGTPWPRTLLPPDQAAVLESRSGGCARTLGRQLGEHVALAVGALRAGATNSPDFPAAAARVERQHRDLTASIGSLFGSRPATSSCRCGPTTSTSWSPTRPGSPADDGSRRERSATELRAFESRLAAFIDPPPATGWLPRRWRRPDLARRHADAPGRRVRGQGLPAGQRPLLPRPTRTCSGWPASCRTPSARPWPPGCPQGGAQTGAGGTAAAPGSAMTAAASTAHAHARRPLLVAGLRCSPWSAERFPSGRHDRRAGRGAATGRGAPAAVLPLGTQLPGGGAARPVTDPRARRRLAAAAARAGAGPDDPGSGRLRAAGWFADGPRPGQAGPAVILGHVDSDNRPGCVLPAVRARAGRRGDGAAGRRQHDRVPGDRRAAGPEDRVPHPGWSTDPACVRRCAW